MHASLSLLRDIGFEVPVGSIRALHLGLFIALVGAYCFGPGRTASRVLVLASAVVAALSPLWLIGPILVSAGGSSALYLVFFLGFAPPLLLASSVGAILRRRDPAPRRYLLAGLVAVGYVVGVLLSMGWSVNSALMR